MSEKASVHAGEAASAPAAEGSSDTGGVRELRLALVCYGGVSLAIYMHGITKEISKLAVASAAFERDETTNPFGADETERVWWDLLASIRDGGIGGRKGVRLRVIVDIIAGTSAGGINGVFLAKGLAMNRTQDALRQLWMEKGDIGQLLAGPAFLPASLRGLLFVARSLGRPTKLLPPLRGDQMCVWLHDALEDMDKGVPALAGLDSLISRDHTLELFVPITDFRGYQREIPVEDPGFVKDRTHRHVLTFRHLSTDRTQLGKDFNHTLAFAARATSSFPGAFAPISFDDYKKAVATSADLTKTFSSMFSLYELSDARADETYFIDGGVLDNFPFASAIDAIGRHPAAAEVDRRLVYIEPDPGTGGGDLSPSKRPGMLGTIWGGYASIPRIEAIVDDLVRVGDRNQTVGRLRDIIETNFEPVSAEVTASLKTVSSMPAQPGADNLSEWRARTEKRAAKVAGLSYPSYVRMRIRSVIDDNAAVLAQARDFPPESYHARFVAAVLRQWAASNGLLEKGSKPSEAQVELLHRFDVDYHARRIRFLVAALNWWYRDAGKPGFPARADLDDGKRRLYDRLADLAAIPRDVVRTEEIRESVVEVFASEIVRSMVLERVEEVDAFVDEHRKQLEMWRDTLEAAVSARLPGIEKALHDDVLAMCANWSPQVTGSFLTRYLGFPFWDVLTFPVHALSGLGERDAVRLVRMSPVETKLLAPPGSGKLKGVSIAHFGAFFSKTGRATDYLWGRLDAAERLVALLLDDPEQPGLTPPDPGTARKVFEVVLADEAGLAGAGHLLAELTTKVNTLR